MPASKIKVLIVDDSAFIRQVLTHILNEDPEIEVIGSAPDPLAAYDMILELHPDVLTLDIEMPRMNGLTFLQKIMTQMPMPVVMVSSLTQEGCDVTLRALELGAVDFFPKPSANWLHGKCNTAWTIREKVKEAARARVKVVKQSLTRSDTDFNPTAIFVPSLRVTQQVLAIGASTGGTEAIRNVLMQLPENAPGVVIVQHMPAGFTTSFAKRLDSLCRIHVKEAEDGDQVRPGHALLAPGDFHMELARSGSGYRVKLHQGDPVNRHRPSVDRLFDSVAAQAGKNAVAAILTGMGDDGSRGLLKLRQAGGRTIAQNEATCVVFGMPREAIALGGAEVIAPISQIAKDMLRMATEPITEMRAA